MNLPFVENAQGSESLLIGGGGAGSREQQTLPGGKSEGHGTTALATWFSVVCTMAGTGILQLPYTLKQGGWVCVALICLCGAVTNYTGKALVRCLYSTDDGRRLDGYAAIGGAAYGRPGRVVVHVFHKATLFGVTTIFLILAAKFLTEGVGGGGEGLVASLGNDAAHWGRVWTAVSAGLLLLPVVGLDTIAEIAPLSALGMLASLLTVLVVTCFSIGLAPLTLGSVAAGVPGIVPDGAAAAAAAAAAIGNFTGVAHSFSNAGSFPSAFSAITLSFGGHAVFPSIEAHMAQPAQFAPVLDYAYVALMAMYLLTAVVGYWAFGDLTYSPILCNLPRGPAAGWQGELVCVTKLVVAFHVLTAYPILMSALVNELEALLGISSGGGGGGGGKGKGKGKGLLLAEEDEEEEEEEEEEHVEGAGACGVSKAAMQRALLRTSCVSLTAIIALYCPYFPEFMTLVGAACLTMIVFVLPVVFSWKLRGAGMGVGEKVFGWLIIAIGAFGGGIGCVQAVRDIAAKLSSGASE